MKRNTLTTAVLAGLTGVAGMVSVSNAVNINPDGLGQVLLYPYYTTRGGNDTLISIVNTTDRGKAVKIRFIEALNSREVLDFNIYMSEWDVWAAAVTDTGQGGARFLTSDTTCTTPYFFGNGIYDQGNGTFGADFVDLLYTPLDLPEDPFDANDRGPQTIDRTRSGYIEVVEMGVLGFDDINNQDVEAAARHGTTTGGTSIRGVPPLSGSSGSFAQTRCGLFQERWIAERFTNGNGIWWNENNPNSVSPGSNPPPLNTPERGLDAPIGGLFGNAAIINNEAGTMMTYEATALDNFWFDGQIAHRRPQDVEPGLGSSLNTDSVVFISQAGGSGIQATSWANEGGIFAVNHVLTINTLMNEYNINPGLGGLSEWVVTFPTKRFHTDAADGGFGLTAPIPPFTELWTNSDPDSCEVVGLEVWDREEQRAEFTGTAGEICPSPLICDPEEVRFELCREANIVRFGAEAPAAAPGMSEIFGESAGFPYGYVNLALPQNQGGPFVEGWARFSFNAYSSVEDDQGRVVDGLPAIGFWANTFQNDAVADGVLANFGGSFRHRGSRAPLRTP